MIVSSPKPTASTIEKVDVPSRDDLVHGDLHVEWRGEYQQLQDHGKHEELHERVAASAQVGPEDGERQSRALILAHEPLGRRKLERDAGQMFEASASERYFSPEAGS